MDRKHKKHKSSICLKILSADGNEELAMLQAYDKKAEIYAALGQQCPSDIENRIRLDLNLSYGWFHRRSINGDRLKTIKDLLDYIDKKHKGDWLAFLQCEFAWALEKTCLFHMWEFDADVIAENKYKVGQFGLKLPYEAYIAMLCARGNLRVTDEERRLASLGVLGPMAAKWNPNPYPRKLSLDMGIVNKA
jgi:hypothetical protein